MWIIYILIGLFILGCIGAVMDWISEHKGIIALVIIVVVCALIFGIKTTLLIIVTFIVIFFVIGLISQYIMAQNERKLNDFLVNNCIKMGYMKQDSWRKKLPQFANKMYQTSFEEITDSFAKSIEERYIENDKKLKWLDPAVLYLTNNLIASVSELEKVPSEGLKYTHSTPDAKLIYDAMENLCKAKIVEGKHMIQKIVLDEDAVKGEIMSSTNEGPKECYKVAYRINDYFANKRKNTFESNIETEEISLDDL